MVWDRVESHVWDAGVPDAGCGLPFPSALTLERAETLSTSISFSVNVHNAWIASLETIATLGR